MIKNFFLGISSYDKAFSLFFHPRIFKYVIRTAMVSLILAFVMFALIVYSGAQAIIGITSIPESASNVEKLSRVITEVFPLLIWLVIAFTLYKNIVLTVCSPFLSAISSETEVLLKGKEDVNESSWAQLLREIWRSIRMALWATFQELKYTLPLLLLNFIPIIGNFAAFILIFLVQSYFSGANNLDFTLERRKHDVRESLAIIKNNQALVTGSGAVFMLIMYIPFVGFLVAPALAVISATVLYVEEIKLK